MAKRNFPEPVGDVLLCPIEDGELLCSATVKKSLTVQREGRRSVSRRVDLLRSIDALARCQEIAQ